MADLKESIALCCKQLKISSNFAERAMSQEGETNQEYLYNLLSNEVTYRTERRKTKLLNTAGFPKMYTPEQFRTDEIDFPSGVSLESLLGLEFYHKGKNLIFYGSTGTGKTMLSTLVGIAACNEDIPVKFLRHYPEFVSGNLNVSELARVCELSRPTVYKYLKLLK